MTFPKSLVLFVLLTSSLTSLAQLEEPPLFEESDPTYSDSIPPRPEMEVQMHEGDDYYPADLQEMEEEQEEISDLEEYQDY